MSHDKDAIKKGMLSLAKQFEGQPVDYDAKDGPQCADLSAFLIKNTTGKTIWGNAIETDNKQNIDIINENPEVEAKHVDPHELEPGDLLVESNGNPRAMSPGNGTFKGLYQMGPDAWKESRNQAGWG